MAPPPPLAALSKRTLEGLEAEVAVHKRAIVWHKEQLHAAAAARDRLRAATLKQFGVEVVAEQKAQGDTHGQEEHEAKAAHA